MQTQPQIQHPHLLLSDDTLLSFKFLFQVLFPLIIFRVRSPHHLIKARVFCRLFLPSPHHSLQQCKTKRGPVNNRGGFYSQRAQSLTACSSYWQSHPAFSETLFISKTLKPFQEDSHPLFLFRSADLKCITTFLMAVPKWLSLLTIYTKTKGFAGRNCPASLSFPASITVTLDIQRTNKQNPSRHYNN